MESAVTISLSSSTTRILAMALEDPFGCWIWSDGSNGELEGERRSLPDLARHGQFASVEAHDFAADRESEAEAHAALLAAVADLVQALEDVREVLRADALARVGHGDTDGAGRARTHRHRDHDRSTRWRELQAVVDEVADDLRDAVRIDRGVGEIRGDALFDPDPRGLGATPEPGGDAVHESDDGLRARSHGQPTGLHARDVEDVVEARRHLIAALLDIAEVLDLRRAEFARQAVEEDRDELARRGER